MEQVDMTLIRMLLAVADSGSLTRAASVLGVDRGTVTRRIAELEAEAGTALLVRHSGGVRLTHAGRRLADAAAVVAEAMAGFRDTLDAAGAPDADATGHGRSAAAPAPCPSAGPIIGAAGE